MSASSPRTPVKKRRPDRALSLGRVVLAAVSMEHTLLKLSHDLVSLSADLKQNIRHLPKADYHSSQPPSRRPCIHLGRTPNGGHRVIPMGTFSGMAPEAWDRLLFHIAIPVGDDDSEARIPAALRGRKVYDSIPPWVPSDGLSAYILPCIVTLPASCSLRPLVEVVPEADVKTLEKHCQELARHMVSDNTPEALLTLIKSFLTYRKQQRKLQKKKKSQSDTDPDAASDVDSSRPPSQCSDYSSDSGSSIASTSTLNPMAEAFVPRFLSSSSARREHSMAPGAALESESADEELYISPLRFHQNQNKGPVRARLARKSFTIAAAAAAVVPPSAVEPGDAAEKENVPVPVCGRET